MSYKAAFRKVMGEFESQRKQTEHLKDERKQEIYAKLPRVAEIDRETGILGASIARCALSQDASKLSDLRGKIALLKAERDSILEETGVAELESVYKCSKCKDTGFVQLTQTSTPTRCACLNQRLIDEYYSLSNVRQILNAENFDMFDLRLFSENIQESEGLSPHTNMQYIYKLTTNFVKNFDDEFNNLLLYGGTGLGKTFACHCIAKDLLDKGRTVLYLTAPRLCKVIEDYRFNRDALTEPDEMLDAVDNVDLLILDDLGAEVSTVITSAALFDIINQRLISYKHTVISTNLTPTALEAQYSERIVSRFFGNYQMIKFFGEDIRLKKKYGSVRI